MFHANRSQKGSFAETTRKMKKRVKHGLGRHAIRRQLHIEPLESRQLLTSWLFQGPAPTQDGQLESGTQPNQQVMGAIHTVLAHPTDANILYIGSVNGGIWKTTNAKATNPTWTPQTDDQASLSIGAMEFDPTDSSSNTLVAGTARYSAFAGTGGSRGNILRTTDGGTTWSDPGSSGLARSISQGVVASTVARLTADWCSA